MGFSTSGATAIIFVGLFVAAGIAYPTIQTAHEQRSAAIDGRDERALELRNTAISDANATYDNATNELTVNVTNTGSTTLSVSDTDLLVDGAFRQSGTWTAVAVDGTAGRDLWQPGERLTIEVTSADEPDRVKLVTEHGVAATVTDVEVV